MIDIIAVTYGHDEILKCFINSIKSQTNKNWRLFIIHDGENTSLKNDLSNNGYLVDGKVIFLEYPIHSGSYGHKLRKWGLDKFATNNYVLITNCDNYYTPNMVDEVLKIDADFIYFDMVHSHPTPNNENKIDYGFLKSKTKRGFLDMGSVVVKTDLAKKVGFNDYDYSADWKYFDKILKLSPKIHKVDKVLFVHN